MFLTLFSLEKALGWLLKSRMRFLLPLFLKVALFFWRILRGKKELKVSALPAGFDYEFTGNAWSRSSDFQSRSKELEMKLWSGFSAQAEQELIEIADAFYGSASERAEANWVLARRNFVLANYEKVLEHLVKSAYLQPIRMFFVGYLVLRIETLIKLGKVRDAHSLLDAAKNQDIASVDLLIAQFNLSFFASEEGGDLGILNAIYSDSGLFRLCRKDPSQKLTISNLKAVGSNVKKLQKLQPKVSVLVPVYNAAETLSTAVDGLVNQTWKNLEIILVDDLSSDHSWQIMQQLAAETPQLRILRHQVNSGAYEARLTGLKAAEGDFITVHDADDWSHPQKIEMQVRALLERASLKACMSSWCRTTADLYVLPIGAIPGKGYQRQNESSLMFHRSLLSEIGHWDRVRAGADTEYIWRIESRYGKSAVDVVLPDIPLSFSLSMPDSLTQTGSTHVRTIFYGTRRTYREVIKHVHKKLPEMKAVFREGERSSSYFYAPSQLVDKSSLHLDILFIGDFTRLTPLRDEQIEEIHTFVNAEGVRVGLFSWKYYATPAMEPLDEVYLEKALYGQLDLVTADDVVYAKKLVFLDSGMCSVVLDRYPRVYARQLFFPDTLSIEEQERLKSMLEAWCYPFTEAMN